MMDLDELIVKQKILIVDSDIKSAGFLNEILQPFYNVTSVLTSNEAFKESRQNKPNLILLDVLMTDIDSYQTCKYLSEMPETSEIPIILLSERYLTEDEQKGFNAGCADYIMKPFNRSLVLARVSNHLKLASQKNHLLSLVKERTKELELTRIEILDTLGRAGDYKDNASSLHVVRISHYARLLARKSTGNKSWSEILFNATPIHDIGKIGISDDILLKKTALNASEQALLEKHVDFGVEILGENKSDLLSMAVEVVQNHHEKWDGSGYPNGLSGDNIPLSARIVAIADVFDGLTSGRPYKAASSVEESIAYLERESGKHFDPNLITIFKKYLPKILVIKDQYTDK